MKEEQQLPHLIIIDGGKGQLSAAVQALRDLNIYSNTAVFGIAKKLEEIYRPGDADPLYIDKKSEALKLLQHLRNEAHRFAVSFHRQKRSQAFTKSGLEDIKGIGKETANKLISHFGSVKRIKKASVEELEVIIGKSKAEIIKKACYK